ELSMSRCKPKSSGHAFDNTSRATSSSNTKSVFGVVFEEMIGQHATCRFCADDYVIKTQRHSML
ncbi:MAG: hypothetical protein AAF922_04475, partial [Pseudomonadota bacterium]